MRAISSKNELHQKCFLFERLAPASTLDFLMNDVIDEDLAGAGVAETQNALLPYMPMWLCILTSHGDLQILQFPSGVLIRFTHI